MRALPKSPVTLVIIFVILIISGFMHAIQQQKYQKAIKFLKDKSKNNIPLKQGGTKHTMEIYRRACSLYEQKLKDLKEKGDKNAGKVKMIKDPLFDEIIDTLVMEVKIEGAAKKPELIDLFAIHVLKTPYYLYLLLSKYHKRYYTDSSQWTKEEKEEIAKDTVGLGLWDDLSDSEREKLIEGQVWLPNNYSKFIKEDDLIDSDDENGSMKPGFHKTSKSLINTSSNNKKKNKKE